MQPFSTIPQPSFLTIPGLPVRRLPESPRRDYFFLSNDELWRPQLGPHPAVFVGVANSHAPHVLSWMLRQSPVQAAVFIDVNAGQLNHLARQFRMALASGSRLEYVERLFCVRLKQRAVEALEIVPPSPEIIRGSITGAELMSVEEEIWDNLVFHEERFFEQYRLRATRLRGGLHIETSVLGHRIKQHLHIFACRRCDEDCCPLTLSYGCGFQESEETFVGLRRALEHLPMLFVCEDVGARLDDLLRCFAHEPVLFSCSNIFHEFFLDKFPQLKRAAGHLIRAARRAASPAHGVTLIRDMREPESQPRALNAVGPKSTG
jgi:hypothetical protein